MNKQERSEWTAAIRSGEYDQGRSALCSATREGGLEYCCLGVKAKLDDALEPGTGGFKTRTGVLGGYHYYYGRNGELEDKIDTTLAPNEMYEHLDLAPKQVQIYAILAWMNDNGWTFAQIADWIDANVPVVD